MHVVSPAVEPAQTRIFVIDDEPGLTALLGRILRRAHAVATESDPRHALARLVGDESFDLVLCDVLMAPIGGFEIYEQAVQLRPELASRFVLMSGGTINDELERRVRAWRHGLLRKPFHVDEVTRLVAARLLVAADHGCR